MSKPLDDRLIRHRVRVSTAPWFSPQKLSILMLIGLASCAWPPVSGQSDEWPPEPDESCWNNAPAMDYVRHFVERVFARADIPPPAGFRMVIAPDGTLTRFEVDGDLDASALHLEPIPVPPDAQCITNVTLEGAFDVPGEKRDPPAERSLARPGESATFEAVVEQILDDADLADGSRVVRARIQLAPSREEPGHPLTVTCWSPPTPVCPSAAGESGSFSIYLEPVEARFVVERYEPAAE